MRLVREAALKHWRHAADEPWAVRMAAGALLAGIVSLATSTDMIGRGNTMPTREFRPTLSSAVITTPASREDCAAQPARTMGGSPSTH